jgi:ribonuclease Z
MIDVMLLGTGAMMPLPNRWLSVLALRCQGEGILFDCGEGTQIACRALGWGTHDISAICLSHGHADHVAGLPGMLHTMGNSRRLDPITIYGPAGTEEIVAGLRTIAPHLPYAVSVVELRERDCFGLPGGLLGSVIAGDHRVPSLIYRVDLPRAPRFDRDRAEALGVPMTAWSRLQRGESVWLGDRAIAPDEVLGPPRPGLSLGFMTDTRPVPGAPEFLRGVDLLVCEGTYGDSAMVDKAMQNKHMTFAEAAGIARDAEARALWLTHFSPAMPDPEAFSGAATAIFPATTVGFSGLSASLAFRES